MNALILIPFFMNALILIPFDLKARTVRASIIKNKNPKMLYTRLTLALAAISSTYALKLNTSADLASQAEQTVAAPVPMPLEYAEQYG